MSIDKSTSLEEQYDKIYRYCYLKVKHRELAEDITQETFLRFYERFGHYGNGWTLPYLYRIAHNLCIDEYRRKKKEVLWEMANEGVAEESRRKKKEVLWEMTTEGLAEESQETRIVTKLLIEEVMSVLSEEEKEILLLRYVNEVEIGTICKIYHISRFALYRKIKKAIGKMQNQLKGEEIS